MPQLRFNPLARAMMARGAAKAKGAPAPAAAPAAPGLDIALLAALVAATQNPAHPFMWHAKTDTLGALVAAGHAEVRDDIVNRENATEIAARATPSGITSLPALQAAAAAAAQAPAAAPAPVASPFGTSASNAFAAPPAPAPAPAPAALPMAAPVAAPVAATPSSFPVAANVPIPAGGTFGKTATYPFETLAVGLSFFVAATPDRTNPKKTLASTVNSANKRYADREFVLRAVPDGAAWGQPGKAGAGVWRTK